MSNQTITITHLRDLEVENMLAETFKMHGVDCEFQKLEEGEWLNGEVGNPNEDKPTVASIDTPVYLVTSLATILTSLTIVGLIQSFSIDSPYCEEFKEEGEVRALAIGAPALKIDDKRDYDNKK